VNDGAHPKITAVSQAITTFSIKSPLSRGKDAKQHSTGTAVLTIPMTSTNSRSSWTFSRSN